MKALIKIRIKYLIKFKSWILLSLLITYILLVFYLVYKGGVLNYDNFLRVDLSGKDNIYLLHNDKIKDSSEFENIMNKTILNFEDEKECKDFLLFLQKLNGKKINFNPCEKNSNETFQVEITNNENKYIFNIFFNNLNKTYNTFIFFQSLFSKYLIKKYLNITSLKKDLIINSLFNINLYNEDNKNKFSILNLVSLFISLYFSITIYFLTIRMIDEKEKKLYIFLRTLGVSKIKYILSWIFFYFITILLPLILFILLFSILITDYFIYFLLSLFLYIISLLSTSYFFLYVYLQLKLLQLL